MKVVSTSEETAAIHLEEKVPHREALRLFRERLYKNMDVITATVDVVDYDHKFDRYKIKAQANSARLGIKATKEVAQFVMRTLSQHNGKHMYFGFRLSDAEAVDAVAEVF